MDILSVGILDLDIALEEHAIELKNQHVRMKSEIKLFSDAAHFSLDVGLDLLKVL